jgi:hypothetical protein
MFYEMPSVYLQLNNYDKCHRWAFISSFVQLSFLIAMFIKLSVIYYECGKLTLVPVPISIICKGL